MEASREQAARALAEWEDRKETARLVDERPVGACYCDLVGWCAVCDEQTARPQVGFYVTVRDAGRTGYLVGPLDTHEEALGHVEEARRIACEVNDRGVWYAYGTARVESYGTLPLGRFNDRFGLPARSA